MLFNKEKRIKYLGFDDRWFMTVAIIILSIITTYLFNDSIFSLPLVYVLINWGTSLFFTICNWMIMRTVVILLRKKYPELTDDVKRLVLLFLAIVATVLLVDFLGIKLLSYIFQENLTSGNPSRVRIPVIIISTMSMSIYEAIYYNIRLKKSIREEEQAKQVMVQAQLDTLRNQAQPHFLFNSLNTLRDIIDENPREDATKFVDKLSDVYRFILESGSANLASLRDEVKFAHAYIHIQRERFGDNLQVNWKLPEDKLGSMIVPMSLQLLLENAIKHNVVSKATPLVINVAIRDDNLSVSNKIQAKSTQLPSTKLGLKNIEKRYSLIAGKSPIIKNDGNQFEVLLPLLKLTDQKNHDENTDY